MVLLQDGDSPARRERLVREVALTATLSHPHVVPTYHYTITPVLMGSLDEESGSWGLGRPPRWGTQPLVRNLPSLVRPHLAAIPRNRQGCANTMRRAG